MCDVTACHPLTTVHGKHIFFAEVVKLRLKLPSQAATFHLRREYVPGLKASPDHLQAGFARWISGFGVKVDRTQAIQA